ncbi:unnamed protein product [Chrysoparadoxa australica]
MATVAAQSLGSRTRSDSRPSTRAKEGAPRTSTSSSTKTESGSGASGGHEIIEQTRRNSKGETVVVRRFLKGRFLGKGGFAKCYKATCLEDKAIYAMKLVPKSNLTKSRARQKLQSEIKIHRSLNHKYVVRFDHFFEDRDNVYILLELCHNHSMSELMRKSKRFSEEEARRFMIQILEATTYLHQNQIIHRDLKLGNLFLDKNWDIKVGDFGLAAKLTEDNERKRTICGTPNYIAPEILDGKAGHSYQVDIWSVGVILYTMLVGRPPYESRDVKSTYRRILSNVYSFPDGVTVCAAGRDLIGRMLQTKPEMRPSLEEIFNHPFIRNGGPMVKLSDLPSLSSSEDPRSTGGDAMTAKTFEGVRRQPLQARNSNLDTGVENRGKVMDGCKPAGKTFGAGAGVGLRTLSQRMAATKASLTGAGRSKPVVAAPAAPSAFNIFSDAGAAKENAPPLPPEPTTAPCTPRQLSSTVSTRAHQSRNSSSSNSMAGAGSRNSARSSVDTLESMHSILCETLAQGSNAQPTSTAGLRETDVWVTNYVDYTSKYGLGFLLSSGSAGVYFNDATKIVMSGTTDMFDYIERSQSQSSNGSSSSYGADPTWHRYTLSAYPPDLQKKVTLLKHFRNYLMEQRLKGPQGAASEECNDLQSANMEELQYDTATTEDLAAPSLVHLKKWVRTRHAILFRLSHRVIQVVFFDRSEILLSAEGKLVVFVDKAGKRESFGLGTLLSSGREDAIKRLKYARDMMQQLLDQSREKSRRSR